MVSPWGRRRRACRSARGSRLALVVCERGGGYSALMQRPSHLSPGLTPNPSIEGTCSGLRPPHAPHVERWASEKQRSWSSVECCRASRLRRMNAHPVLSPAPHINRRCQSQSVGAAASLSLPLASATTGSAAASRATSVQFGNASLHRTNRVHGQRPRWSAAVSKRWSVRGAAAARVAALVVRAWRSLSVSVAAATVRSCSGLPISHQG